MARFWMISNASLTSQLCNYTAQIVIFAIQNMSHVKNTHLKEYAKLALSAPPTYTDVVILPVQCRYAKREPTRPIVRNVSLRRPSTMGGAFTINLTVKKLIVMGNVFHASLAVGSSMKIVFQYLSWGSTIKNSNVGRGKTGDAFSAITTTSSHLMECVLNDLWFLFMEQTGKEKQVLIEQ